MPFIPPISKGEFLQFLQKCIPPRGWPRKIAIANSGGPDSVCLLYLLASLLKERGSSGLPSDIVSLHVDHNLQAASTLMAEQAAQSAEKLGVPHLTLRIPWSTDPFPPHPGHSASFEGVCRHARRNRLFQAMSKTSAFTISFAHHADDQVETSIMRLASGSSNTGASGMKPICRWGMGEREKNSLTWAGAQGMNRYIVRPLLGVSKDRILATCEANGLQYVTDPTNSQPDITLRNYVRDVLKRSADRTKFAKDKPHIPFADKAAQVDATVESLRTKFPHGTGPSRLRDAVRQIGDHVEQVDMRVTNLLKHHVLPSPPTTILLPSSALSTIEDTDTRVALVRRVLRYVSPHPWGHMSAEAGGSRRTFEAIVDRVWPPKSRPAGLAPASFTLGAKVWWRQVYLRNDRVGFGIGKDPNEKQAWLVQRERPWAATRLRHTGMSDPLTKDITSELREAHSKRSSCSILFDCRVLLEFDMALCPLLLDNALQTDSDTSVIFMPATGFYLPQVVMRRPGTLDKVLATFPWPSTQMRKTWIPNIPDVSTDDSWIQMSLIRTWDPW